MALEIIYLPIKNLKAYDKNTRKHKDRDIEQICLSIEKYGMNDPIGIWGGDNTIVEGHGRLYACRKLGFKEVPCIRLDHLTDQERREYAIAHNKTAELSEWDYEMLAEEIPDIDLSDFDFEFNLPEPRGEVVEDEAPDVDMENPPRTQLGDIYQLGRHRLMCGDSTDEDTVSALMDGELAELLITDPPYNVDYTGKTKDALKIENDRMSDDGFYNFLCDAFKCAIDHLKDGSAFYIWHADSEGHNFRAACKEVGFKVRECLIWVKNSLVLGRQDYQWKHEPCLYGWKDGAGHNWYNDRKQTTVLEFDRPTKSKEHPTMKPIALFDYQICNSSRQGDRVLDLFGGSGTTLMACEQNNRISYTMELDPRYCDVIVKRWEAFTGEKATLLNREE